jgi:hypothetical protein
MDARQAAEYLGIAVDRLRELEKNDPSFRRITYRPFGDGPKAPRRYIPSELREWVTRASRNRCSPETPGEWGAA